jgi:hypothetical protein
MYTGATLCATDDGRRLYLFGGHDGSQLLADVHYLEVERMAWSQIAPSGHGPEPREGHTASVLGKYMLVTGGSGAAAAGGGGAAAATAARSAATTAREPGAGGGGGSAGAGAQRRLTDTFVLDLFTGPRWERLDDGAWGGGPLWLKAGASYSALAGSKLLTLRPDLHESLHELQVGGLTHFLPSCLVDLCCCGRKTPRLGSTQPHASACKR